MSDGRCRIRIYQPAATSEWIVLSVAFFDTISMAVRTPAGYSSALPAIGNNITNSANPTVKFTVFRVWLVVCYVTGISSGWRRLLRVSQGELRRFNVCAEW